MNPPHYQPRTFNVTPAPAPNPTQRSPHSQFTGPQIQFQPPRPWGGNTITETTPKAPDKPI